MLKYKVNIRGETIVTKKKFRGSLYICNIFGAIWIVIKNENEIYFIPKKLNQPIKF